MPKRVRFSVVLFIVFAALGIPSQYALGYDNFKVAVYSRAYETEKMKDLDWLQSFWTEFTNQVHADKIYLETHRDLLIVDDETLNKAKKFFADRGIETAGGITLTVEERNRFETFCYTNPEHRQKVKEIIEHTAKHFDEVILDDFFFTNCICENCVKEKGGRTWSEFRLELMNEVMHEIVLKPAKAVNPDVVTVIKYPNWYERFHGRGYDLESEPKFFDLLYTGTETRSDLQEYQGYLIMRYLDNVKPGANAGGWVDTGGLRNMDRYAEQLWLTLFAKAPEITLFDVRQMQLPIRETLRAPWQGNGTSFDFDTMMQPIRLKDGTTVEPTTYARAAGLAFEEVDKVLGKLGNPIGVKSYKPYHSTGENQLHNFLGNAGIPIDLVPEFPYDANIVLLTETAKHDEDIMNKIKRQLMDGKKVFITSGLLRELQERGIKEIAEITYTDKKVVMRGFSSGRGVTSQQTEIEIILPKFETVTRDSWEDVQSVSTSDGDYLLFSHGYGKGALYVLTIPDSQRDIYKYPAGALNRIRQAMTSDIYVRLEGPALVSLFVYDNDTFIVESFLPEPVDIRLVVDNRIKTLSDVLSGETLSAPERPEQTGRQTFGRMRETNTTTFEMTIKPHSYRVFQGK